MAEELENEMTTKEIVLGYAEDVKVIKDTIIAKYDKEFQKMMDSGLVASKTVAQKTDNSFLDVYDALDSLSKNLKKLSYYVL